jgi:hypothetical protein
MEVGVQTPEETLRIRVDLVEILHWLLIHVLRHFGLAAERTKKKRLKDI